MDTVALLNNYRHSLLKDPIGLKAVVTICREGPKEEEELADQLGVENSDLRKHITALFRANLVHFSADEKWIATDLAHVLLKRFGLYSSVLKSFLQEAKLSVSSKNFLDAILEARLTDEMDWSRILLPYFQCASDLTKEISDREFVNSELQQRLFWYVYVLLDPLPRELGSLGFYKYIIQWQKNHRPASWADQSKYWSRNKSVFTTYLSTAIHDVSNCNNWLMEFRGSHSSHSKQRHINSILATTRSLAAMLAGDADTDLKRLSRETDLADSLWSGIARTEPSLIQPSISILRRHGKLSEELKSEKDCIFWLTHVFEPTVTVAFKKLGRASEEDNWLLSTPTSTKGMEKGDSAELIAMRYAFLKWASQDRQAFEKRFRQRVEFWLKQFSSKNTVLSQQAEDKES